VGRCEEGEVLMAWGKVNKVTLRQRQDCKKEDPIQPFVAGQESFLSTCYLVMVSSVTGKANTADLAAYFP
jgi:hypothetical protein